MATSASWRSSVRAVSASARSTIAAKAVSSGRKSTVSCVIECRVSSHPGVVRRSRPSVKQSSAGGQSVRAGTGDQFSRERADSGGSEAGHSIGR